MTRSYKTSSFDAWVLLTISFFLYLLGQLLLTRLTILGATAAGQLLFFLIPALLYGKWKCGSIQDALRLKPVPSGILWRIPLLAVTFMGVIDILQRILNPLMQRYFKDFIPMIEALEQTIAAKSAPGFVANILIVGFIAPFCEELLFRGAFQGTLEKKGATRAILYSSLMFACIHMNPIWLSGIFLTGIVLGYVTWRTQSLWPAILWHTIHNTISVCLASIGSDQKTPYPIWISIMLAVTFIGLAWEFVRRTRTNKSAQTCQLATAPDLFGEKIIHLASGIATISVLILGALIFCYRPIRISTNLLSPDYTKGDVAIFAYGPAFSPKQLKTGDAVLLRREEGGLAAARILAIQGERIKVLRNDASKNSPIEAETEWKNISGKMIWKFEPGSEVKEWMNKLEQKR